MKQKIARAKELWQAAKTMPRLEVNLMLDKTADNDAFFAQVTKNFYQEATQRHRKFPLIRQYEYGVALYQFNDDKEGYVKAIESSARRNYKKALRNGYYFKPIDFNDHLDDIWDIRRSTTVRQGDMPEEFINQKPEPRNDPKSVSTCHDYPYFGIFNAEHKLVAYCACLIAGELCMVEHIYGHFGFQTDGVVPMLLIETAHHIAEHYPQAKVYSYGTFYGAGGSMQRFKKKFQFLPYKVTWKLN